MTWLLIVGMGSVVGRGDLGKGRRALICRAAAIGFCRGSEPRAPADEARCVGEPKPPRRRRPCVRDGACRGPPPPGGFHVLRGERVLRLRFKVRRGTTRPAYRAPK